MSSTSVLRLRLYLQAKGTGEEEGRNKDERRKAVKEKVNGEKKDKT